MPFFRASLSTVGLGGVRLSEEVCRNEYPLEHIFNVLFLKFIEMAVLSVVGQMSAIPVMRFSTSLS